MVKLMRMPTRYRGVRSAFGCYSPPVPLATPCARTQPYCVNPRRNLLRQSLFIQANTVLPGRDPVGQRTAAVRVCVGQRAKIVPLAASNAWPAFHHMSGSNFQRR